MQTDRWDGMTKVGVSSKLPGVEDTLGPLLQIAALSHPANVVGLVSCAVHRRTPPLFRWSNSVSMVVELFR